MAMISVSFTAWPREGAWPAAVFELFGQFPRVEMEFEEDAWLRFQDQLVQAGVTLRELELTRFPGCA